MNKKRTIISILIYVSLLIVTGLAFIGFTSWKQAEQYVNAYIATKEIQSGQQIDEKTFNDCFIQKRIPADIKEQAKDYGTTIIENASLFRDKVAIGYIPAGTYLYANMFSDVKIEDNGLVNLLNVYRNKKYIVLPVVNESAPAEGYEVRKNIGIENINAFTMVNSYGVEQKIFGLLVNKAEIYTVITDTNGIVTNVGIVCEADDAKMLTSLADAGINFRFIKGKTENMPLTSWTTNDVTGDLYSKIVNSFNPEKVYYHSNTSLNDDDLSLSVNRFNNAKFDDTNFRQVPTFNLADHPYGFNFLFEGRVASVNVKKFGLFGTIDETLGNCTNNNGKLNYNEKSLMSSITVPFKEEGYYELEVIGEKVEQNEKEEFVVVPTKDKYHFIIENDTANLSEEQKAKYEYQVVSDTIYADSNTMRPTINGSKYIYRTISNLDNMVKFKKPYYNTCLPLTSYYETLDFSEKLKTQYASPTIIDEAEEGVDFKDSLTNVDFVIDHTEKIGTLKGKEIKNIFLEISGSNSLPIFYKTNKTLGPGIAIKDFQSEEKVNEYFDFGEGTDKTENILVNNKFKYEAKNILQIIENKIYSTPLSNNKNTDYVNLLFAGTMRSEIKNKSLKLRVECENGSLTYLKFVIR